MREKEKNEKNRKKKIKERIGRSKQISKTDKNTGIQRITVSSFPKLGPKITDKL